MNLLMAKLVEFCMGATSLQFETVHIQSSLLEHCILEPLACDDVSHSQIIKMLERRLAEVELQIVERLRESPFIAKGYVSDDFTSANFINGMYAFLKAS